MTDKLPDSATLGEARELLDEHLSEGIECPCCEQYARVYKRSLNAVMIYALRSLSEAGGDRDFVHGPTVLRELASEARELGKIAYFLLIEEENRRRPDGGRSGYWKLTEQGREFLRGEIGVAKYAVVYNGQVLEYEGKTVYVQDIVEGFDYRKLMEVR